MARILFSNSYIKLTNAKLIEFANSTVVKLTGNSYFPVIQDPTLADYITVINTLNTAVGDASNGGKLQILQRDEARQALIDTMDQMCAFLAWASKGNMTAAASSGFPLVKVPSPSPALQKPQNLKVANTNQSGTVTISVDTVRNGVMYMHQYTTDAAQTDLSWQSSNCTQRKCTLTGLTPATVYYFRVVVIGRKEQSMISDVTSMVVA